MSERAPIMCSSVCGTNATLSAVRPLLLIYLTSTQDGRVQPPAIPPLPDRSTSFPACSPSSPLQRLVRVSEDRRIILQIVRLVNSLN